MRQFQRSGQAIEYLLIGLKILKITLKWSTNYINIFSRPLNYIKVARHTEIKFYLNNIQVISLKLNYIKVARHTEIKFYLNNIQVVSLKLNYIKVVQ